MGLSHRSGCEVEAERPEASTSLGQLRARISAFTVRLAFAPPCLLPTSMPSFQCSCETFRSIRGQLGAPISACKASLSSGLIHHSPVERPFPSSPRAVATTQNTHKRFSKIRHLDKTISATQPTSEAWLMLSIWISTDTPRHCGLLFHPSANRVSVAADSGRPCPQPLAAVLPP